jgi:hypothetical protein
MALTPATAKQIPDHAILDFYNKQLYLGQQYTVNLASTVTTSELPIILMSNAGVNTGQQISLFQGLLNGVSLTASHNVVYRVYLNPTVTSAGTPMTPINMRPASPNVPTAVMTSAPSVSANGTLINIMSSQALVNAQSQMMAILDGAESLLVTVLASASATSVETVLGWFEI